MIPTIELTKNKIIQHIESYHPTVSYNQKVNAPLQKHNSQLQKYNSQLQKCFRSSVRKKFFRKVLKFWIQWICLLQNWDNNNVNFVKNTHIIDVKESNILINSEVEMTIVKYVREIKSFKNEQRNLEKDTLQIQARTGEM